MIKLPQIISNEASYWRRWATFYRQWEFWALSLGLISAYALLDKYGLLPGYLAGRSQPGKALLTFLIMASAAYVIKRKQARLRGREDWFERLLHFHSSIPPLVAGLLLLAAFGFCFPIFADAQTSQPISGLRLIIQHPLAVIAPALYVISAVLTLRNYLGWRLTIGLWTIGGYFSMLAVAIAYTDFDADINNGYLWAFLLVVLAPLFAAGLSFLPEPKKRR